MKLKFSKFALLALLLTAGVNAYAEDYTVKLANSETATWEALVNAINNPSTANVDKSALEAAQAAYDNAVKAQQEAPAKSEAAEKAYNDSLAAYNKENAALKVLTDKRDNMPNSEKEQTSLVPPLAKALTSAEAFKTVFDRYFESAGTDVATTPTINYYTEDSGSGMFKKANLYISFANPTVTEKEPWKKNVSVEDFALGAWGTGDSGKSYNFVYLVVDSAYNKAGDTKFTIATNYTFSMTFMDDVVAKLESLYSNPNYTTTAPTSAYTELVNQITAQASVVDQKKAAMDAAEQAYRSAQTAVSNAATNVANAKLTLDDEQAKYDAAVKAATADALAPYKEITLLGNVTANATINSYDGKINGNGYAISLGENVDEVFANFTGSLVYVAFNGTISNALNGKSYNNVATCNGAGGVFRVDNDTRYTANSNGELGMLIREKFGFDLQTGKITNLTDDTKVYNITVQDVKSPEQAYVNLKNNQFVKATGPMTIKDNTFVQSQTSEEAILDLTNVYYNNSCKNAVIVDRVDFYCPADITVDNLSYDRTFTAGRNAVCLPFELKPADAPAGSLAYLSTFDTEEGDTFWFTKKAGSIAANTPILLFANSAFKLKDGKLSNVVLKTTPSDQKVKDEGALDNPSASYGTFKVAGPDEFGGGSNANRVFACTTGGDFVLAANTANFPAMRMVLMSQNRSTNAPQRRVGLRDEYGNVINEDELTGINTVNVLESLSVEGGFGEIIINSEVELGEVEIYTVNGAMVAKANVIAGTTNVDVNKGIYLVMGKKVVVK
ncbi:hypothetical protein HDR58_00450 [bacterium]|nr:hypothetical protein [bacterium]